MTGINLFLLTILYWCGSSTALSFGIGYYTLYRPIISGMITGLILGDLNLGLLSGAIVNIIYIDFVSTGGSLKGDQCLTAIIAAIASIMFKLNPIESAALSFPFGYAGILIWKYRLTINTIFVRLYEKKYKEGLKPNISIYDGLLPQLLLYIMSSIVMILSIGLIILFHGIILQYYEKVKYILYLVGIFLIFSSIFNILVKLKNIKGIILFLVMLSITLVFNINSVIIFILVLLILSVLSRDIKLEKFKLSDNKILSKCDLIYSWFIWMNYSHSCYNYERMQGLAFAHSMKNILKKLYKDDDALAESIYKYTDFFNTEPNMGTPIHGYIISVEEQNYIKNNKTDVSYIKKGMMGIAAGLGDSFTQVVLTPLFSTLSLMLCFENNYALALIPFIILCIIILCISYSGWMNGYINGKESLIKRINQIKNNKIKVYFPVIFEGILGVSLGKLIIENIIFDKAIIIITIISLVYIFLKNSNNKRY